MSMKFLVPLTFAYFSFFTFFTTTVNADATATSSASQTQGLRKNIDELTAEELAAFEHAVKMMKQKSMDNVYDRTGWLWQAWVHNCNTINIFQNRDASISERQLNNILSTPDMDSCNVLNFVRIGNSMPDEQPGMCEHRKNTFLPWHRAELYFYEKALQAADPEGKHGPSTKNVMLPFWNFTKMPSGKRFPKAFENPDSPLYDSTRDTRKLNALPGYASPTLMSKVVFTTNWEQFGGDFFGTDAGGDLETAIHNPMHAYYVGGNMGDNITAGLDPIFYVFHNFIEYAYEEWIQTNGSDKITGSARTDFLRSEQDARLPGPPALKDSSIVRRDGVPPYWKNMGQSDMYFDIAQLGYAFQPSQGGDFFPKAQIEELMAPFKADDFVFGQNKDSLATVLRGEAVLSPDANPNFFFTVPFQIGESIPDPQRLLAVIERGQIHQDYDFQADFFFHPAQNFDFADEAARRRYLVDVKYNWGLKGEHTAHSAVKFGTELTRIVNSLVANQKGQQWYLTVAISGEKAAKTDFAQPKFEIKQ